LLKDTEDDIDNIASIEQRANKTEHIKDVIPRVLAKLKKEMDYGIPEETVLSTKSLQRNKDRTSNNRREWDTNK
tara:strand:- start:42 stop:263 length:222 start_codon:yes stop_codon:yes gene_type:complete